MIFAPSYYNDFKCACGDCTHSCCIAREIGIDKKTYKKYGKLKGDFGRKVRDSIDKDGIPHFSLREDGRCPHLNDKGLCDIIISLGEEYLCDICREHPRFYNFFYQGKEKRCEVGLGAACESAARLILLSDSYDSTVPLGIPPIKAEFGKKKCVDFLGERARIYGMLNEQDGRITDRILSISKTYGVDFDKIPSEIFHSAYSSIEYLNQENKELFLTADKRTPALTAEKSLYVERYFAYLIYRYLVTSNDEEDLALNIAFCAMLSLLFSKMISTEGDFSSVISSAVAISEEIEYNPDNIEQIKFYLGMYGRN